jgi:hypothetical protein
MFRRRSRGKFGIINVIVNRYQILTQKEVILLFFDGLNARELLSIFCFPSENYFYRASINQ